MFEQAVATETAGRMAMSRGAQSSSGRATATLGVEAPLSWGHEGITPAAQKIEEDS